jgi:hypothetical protein
MSFLEVNIVWIGLNWLNDWPYRRFCFCSTKCSCYSMKDLHNTVEVHNIYEIFMTM